MNRRMWVSLRLHIRRFRRFVIYRLLHANDPPHRLALGVAIGLFITFTPTIPFQMGLVVLLAWLLRANKLVGVPIVWITNWFTIVPIYYACYVLGTWVLRMPRSSLGEWRERLADPPEGWLDMVRFYWTGMMDVAGPLWIGCLLISLVCSVVGYFAVYGAVCSYRLRRWKSLVPPRAPHLPPPKS